MIGELERDLAALVVPRVGGLVSTGDRYEPFRLIDAGGADTEPVTAYFRDLLAAGRSEATVRSYGMDLLRGFRAASLTRSSTRSSPGCRRTGTGLWWRSMSRRGRGPRSCCQPGAMALMR